jgi:hypothetical protein
MRRPGPGEPLFTAEHSKIAGLPRSAGLPRKGPGFRLGALTIEPSLKVD